MLKPAVEPYLARRAGEPGEFCESDDNVLFDRAYN